jgi:glycosyltransferase involved in cell wall biosynthesis
VKRLALVTDAWAPQVNGVVTSLSKMIELSANYGWEVIPIHPGLFRSIPTPTYPEIRTVINPWKIAQHLENIDSLHIATEGSLGIAARLIAEKRKIAFTTSYHTNYPDYFEKRTKIPAKLFIPFFRWFHSKSSAIMVPTETTLEKLKSWNFNSSGLKIWSRGYDSVFIPRLTRDPNQDIVARLLYVGRVAPEKNLRDLLEISKNPKYAIRIVGDGPLRKRLEAEYPNVEFVGYKRGKELAEEYAEADVFVFPSLTDTFGIVLIEAMACGTPVAAYPTEGPINIVQQGIGGALDNDLTVAIEKALQIPRSRVLENASLFSWEKSAATFFSNLVSLSGKKID